MTGLHKLQKLLDPEIRAKNLQAMGWAARATWFDLMRPTMPDPVFLVGCSRSGTTVTYETLAAAPEFIKFGYELPKFWDSLFGPLNNGWQSEAAGAGDARPAHRHAAQRHFYARLGLGCVLDKTCINVMRIPYLLALFPQAKLRLHPARRARQHQLDDRRLAHGAHRRPLRAWTQYLGPAAGAGGHPRRRVHRLGVLPIRRAGAPTTAPACPRCAPIQWIMRQPPGAGRGAPGAGAAVDPPALRRHLRAARRDVPARLSSSLGVPFTARTAATALRQPAAHQRRQGQAAVKQKWKEQQPDARSERVLPTIRADAGPNSATTPD
jgi:hypothetical protein